MNQLATHAKPHAIFAADTGSTRSAVIFYLAESMVKIFQDNDAGYLEWVAANAHGFVVNTDNPPSQSMYPMVHAAKHKVVSSPARTNYTTDRYIKICGLDLSELDQFVAERYGRVLSRCKQCMGES
ncbi:MAG: hypothetical protein ABI852_18185 [Gemmatimonadaceae bacterium]